MKVRYKPNIVNALRWEKNNGHGVKIPMYEIADQEADKTFSVTEEQFEKMFDVVEQNKVMKNPFFETDE